MKLLQSTYLLSILAFSYFLCSCQTKESKRFAFSERQMGVEFKYFIYADTEEQAEEAVKAAVARVEELNQCFSDYVVDSELWKLSKSSGEGLPFKVSDDMWYILNNSLKFHQLSDGAFDVTAGSYFFLWRKVRVIKKLPAARSMDKAANKVGMDKMVFDHEQQSVTLKAPGMRLDLGGIAKGYAADEALKVILSHGLSHALVDASGDIAMTASPNDLWEVFLSDGEEKKIFVELGEGAVATSGDTTQFVEIDGKRYSHIINPKTGLGMTNRCRVTIIAEDCESADALASAVTVLGPVKGLELVESIDGVEALVQKVENDQLEIFKSSGFPELKFKKK